MQSINRFLYGPTPEEKVRLWQGKLRAESRQLDREMRQVSVLDSLKSRQVTHDPQLDAATSKARLTVKQLATKGDVKSARILAREVVRSNKQKDRLSVSKARLGSIGTQLTQQLGERHVQELGFKPEILLSHGESHWFAAEIHRDHEALKFAYQTSAS